MIEVVRILTMLPGRDKTMVACSVSLRVSGRVSHLGSCANITPLDSGISWARGVQVSVELVVAASDKTSWITHFDHRLLTWMFVGWFS